MYQLHARALSIERDWATADRRGNEPFVTIATDRRVRFWDANTPSQLPLRLMPSL